MSDGMNELARQLSPLVDIGLDETGSRANGAGAIGVLPDRREGEVISQGILQSISVRACSPGGCRWGPEVCPRCWD
jgi:hypothetical protein